MNKLFIDRDDQLWIAMDGGVSRKDPIRELFQWQPDLVTAICENDEGVWWTASWKGMTRFDPKNMTKKTLSIDQLGISYNNNAPITSCYYDKNQLWFSVHSLGLVRYDEDSGKFEIFTSSKGPRAVVAKHCNSNSPLFR
ncbi:MAG: hypothetical protein IPJ88_10605 [Myxococcales bacterium]|nr:MAG: hypothetical protein IPJ88_10605 [Myxococcales bacterium]